MTFGSHTIDGWWLVCIARMKHDLRPGQQQSILINTAAQIKREIQMPKATRSTRSACRTSLSAKSDLTVSIWGNNAHFLSRERSTLLIMSLLSAFGTITIRTGTLRSNDMSNSKWTVSTGLILIMTFCQFSAAAAIASLAAILLSARTASSRSMAIRSAPEESAFPNLSGWSLGTNK